jgi:hypothetical protein
MTIDNDLPYQFHRQDDTRLAPEAASASSGEPAPYVHPWSGPGGNGSAAAHADERTGVYETSPAPADNGAGAEAFPQTGNGAIHLSNGIAPAPSTPADHVHTEMTITDARDSDGDSDGDGDGDGDGVELTLPDNLTGKLPRFTKPASDCINKARRIARELNHTSVSAAHLALALTLDQRSSRRLRDQGVDVDCVREAAVRNLAKFNFAYAAVSGSAVAESKASPDLASILESATRFPQEKDDEEEINISDLLDAFRKSPAGVKLIYELPEATDQVPALLRRVEQGVGQQLSRLFTDMQLQVEAAPRFERLAEEIERRLDMLPRIELALGDIENRLMTHVEERLTVLLNAAGMRLAQELGSLEGQTQRLSDQIDRVKPTERGGGWWPGSGR